MGQNKPKQTQSACRLSTGPAPVRINGAMELIDTHCHLSFDELAADVDAVIARSKSAGVTGWITVGTDPEHNKKCLELAARFENMYAAVGLHPHDAKLLNARLLDELKETAAHPAVVAIGETGLDFHYNLSSPDDQLRALVAQLEIAADLDLPVIIHCRDAFDQVLDALDKHRHPRTKVVFHCFSGSPEQARLLVDKGFYISFTGIITFKNAQKTRQAAVAVPAERLMLETDCPYMSPEPMRKQRVNEPALLVHTAARLAQLKAMTLPDLADTLTRTTRTFFALPANREHG